MDISDLDLPPLPKPKQPTFKYGSTTYMVLAYAYVYDRAMTIDDFQRLSNKAFRDKGDIKKALLVLVNNKAMEQLNDTYWRITALGMRQVVELAKQNNAAIPGAKKKYPLRSS